MVLLTMAVTSARKRILVVEDDEDLRENLAELFGYEGYEVVTAGNTPEALEMLSRHDVDLVLTDLWMPGKSGIELIEEARARHPGVRAILMTAFGDGYAEIESVRRGAIGYLKKPFEVDEVLSLVTRVLSLTED
jgi:two-component system response regulator FlrC